MSIKGESGVVLAGSTQGFALLDITTANSVYIAKLYSDDEIAAGKAKDFITNDGIVDSKGRFWLSRLGVPLSFDKAVGASSMCFAI